MYQWLFNRGKRKGNTLELYQDPLSKIPIPNLKLQSKNIIGKEIINIIDKIIEIKKTGSKIDTKELEDEMNELVMDLYELNEEEKNLVRNS